MLGVWCRLGSAPQLHSVAWGSGRSADRDRGVERRARSGLRRLAPGRPSVWVPGSPGAAWGSQIRAGAVLGVVLALGAVAGCSAVSPRLPLQERAAGGRFAVSLTLQVVRLATNHGLPIERLTQDDLAQIDSLLPGPPAAVTVTVGDSDQILPSVGLAGFTDPETGAITISLYPRWLEEPPDVGRWLGRTLARQVDRSVRITSGPGFSATLLEQLVAEGVATAFDQSAFPGPPDPWVGALTKSQECQQWGHLRPLLAKVGIHDEVMLGGPVAASTFGESSMPALTGRAIGYQIVGDYLARNPGTSWTELAATSARKIYRASGFSPCRASGG